MKKTQRILLAVVAVLAFGIGENHLAMAGAGKCKIAGLTCKQGTTDECFCSQPKDPEIH